MSIFALIAGGSVANTAVADAAANLPAGEWVQIDTLTPQPGIGSGYSGGAFTAPVVPAVALTLAQQAAVLLAAGLAIASTATAALDATYPASATAQAQLNAEVTSILLNGTFADGTSTIEWLDTADASHAFTIAQFKTLATAIGAFVSGCIKCINGQAAVLPSGAATIP